MSDDVFDFLIRRWFSESTKPSMNLIFHGGEPLTIGKEKLSRFAAKAYHYADEYNKHLELGIQTNATLVDDEWISIFYHYKIGVGISWDGVFENRNYRNNTSKQVFDVLATLNRMQISSGPLMVLSKGNNDQLRENLSLLHRYGINVIKVNRAVDLKHKKPGESDYEMAAEELVESTMLILDFMLAHPQFTESVTMELLSDFVIPRYLRERGGENAHCSTRYCGGLRNLVEVEPDGTFQFCGRYGNDENPYNGSIFDHDILELGMTYKQYLLFSKKKKSTDAYRCDECYAKNICDGGCAAYSLQKFGYPIVDPLSHLYYRKLYPALVSRAEDIRKIMTHYEESSRTPNNNNEGNSNE
jgi:radical SAM protein with 4Fe4S-binding SPASM domain